jgi:hypothetical protein
MRKWLLILTIFCSSFTWAQDLRSDLQFIETQNTLAIPFDVSVYFTTSGEISLLRRNAADLNMSPLAHFGWGQTRSLYIKPLPSEELIFSPYQEGQGWIEVKRDRWEAGAGLGSIIGKNAFSLGLVPYKGARQVMTRHKLSQDEKTPLLVHMPKDFKTMTSWRVGDRGSFQRYGGLQVFVGAGFNLVLTSLNIQNLWSVEIHKIDDNRILLSIAEENLKKRLIQAGAAPLNSRIHFFNGKRLSTQFLLELNDTSHEKLYQLAMKGKLYKLQEKLPSSSQKMEWKGSERLAYVGVPGVAGKHFQRSEYAMDYEDEEDVLDMKSRRNSGFLLPLRNHHRLVYQTDQGIVLFWFSEMNRTDEKDLYRHFLGPGRLMGVKGFEQNLPAETKVGSTLTQLGMSFTREELELIDDDVFEEIMNHYHNRCNEFALNCSQKKQFTKVRDTLKSFMNKKWAEVRDKLGFLMMDEPALIYAYVKTMKLKKRVYFKFLNQKYQSLEGATLIDL